MPEPSAAVRPVPIRAGWKSVVLVCKACEKRSKGPKKIAARDVAKQLGRACRDAKVARARVVLTTCLGICPKKAFTVAAASPGGPVATIVFRRGDDAAAAVAALFPSTADAAPQSNSTSSAPSAT